MGFGLNNNLWAINISRNIDQTSRLLFKSMQKLSSGFRINSAADDPAGLIISEQMRTRIASLNQEIENTTNQINKYQTASSTQLQLRGQLTELRSLAVAAANDGGIDEAQREAYQNETDNLVDSYNQTVENSEFNGMNLLDGSEGSVTTVNKLDDIDLSSAENAEEAINQIDEEISRLDSSISDVGATQKNSLESRLTTLRIESENLQAAESQIRNLDYALEYCNLLKNQMLLQVGVSLLAQGNFSSQMVLALMDDSKYYI